MCNLPWNIEFFLGLKLELQMTSNNLWREHFFCKRCHLLLLHSQATNLWMHMSAVHVFSGRKISPYPVQHMHNPFHTLQLIYMLYLLTCSFECWGAYCQSSLPFSAFFQEFQVIYCSFRPKWSYFCLMYRLKKSCLQLSCLVIENSTLMNLCYFEIFVFVECTSLELASLLCGPYITVRWFHMGVYHKDFNMYILQEWIL